MIELDWLLVSETELPAGDGSAARLAWEAFARVRRAREGLDAWRPPVEKRFADDLWVYDPAAGMEVARRGRNIPADLGLRPEAFERVKTRGGAKPYRRTDASRLRAYLARSQLKRKLVEAGERFERTWRAAGLDPRVSGAYGEGVGGGFDPFDISDARAEARIDLQDVERAVGGVLYRILIRVCVFDETAGTMAGAELERGGRAGEIAGMTGLRLALERLFEHYAALERRGGRA